MNDFILETKNLTKRFGNQTAVDNISLKIKYNSIYGLYIKHNFKSDLMFFNSYIKEKYNTKIIYNIYDVIMNISQSNKITFKNINILNIEFYKGIKRIIENKSSILRSIKINVDCTNIFIDDNTTLININISECY